MSTTPKIGERVERRSRTAFLLSGVLLFGYTVSKGVYTFTEVTPVGAFDVTFGGIGLLVTVVALVSLYPRLSDSAPRSSLAGLLSAVIAAAGDLALLGWLTVATLTRAGYPAVPEEAPAWTVLALIVVFVTMAMGFLLFGVASLRGDVLPRTVRGLLFVPGLGWAALIVGNLALPAGQYLGLVYVPICLALLAIGYLLETGDVPTDSTGTTPESTA